MLVAALFVFLVSEIVPGMEWKPVKVWIAFALMISAAVWAVLLWHTRVLMWAETTFNVDLDKDGKVGERVILMNANRLVDQKARIERQEIERTEMQGTLGQFAAFVTKLKTEGTSQAVWESKIGREQYCEWRDILLNAEAARWNSYDDQGQPRRTGGWSLVVPVATVLRSLSDIVGK